MAGGAEDLADQAIRYVLDAHVNAPEKPFFMYYAPGCGHAPHHVPREWADRYAGRFDAGWDAYREATFARHRGGSTDPFVLSWPAGMAARGEIRTQYAHAIDMVPTVLDALGVDPPAAIRGVPQTALEGVSFAHTFGRTLGQPITPAILDELDRSGWELYRMADDPTESRDLAAEYPDELRELIALWWQTSRRAAPRAC